MENSILLLSSMSKLRALLKIINENDTLTLRELATHTKQNIDKLFPLLYSCSTFGFVKIIKSNVKITDLGKKFLKNPYETTKIVLKKTEPFEDIINVLNETPLRSDEITHFLLKKNVISGNPVELTELLKHSLNSWCITTNILSYNTKKDLWCIKKL